MKFKKLGLSIGLVILILVVSSCAMLPSGIKNLLATKTSTATPTSTATSTPRPSPTPKPSPTPSIEFTMCAFGEDCPYADWVGNYYPGGYISDTSFQEVYFPVGQAIQMGTGWYAKNDDFLADNLEHMEWVLTIDGQDVFKDSYLEEGIMPEENSDIITYPGVWMGVVLQDWKIGEPHEVEIGFIVKEDIYNGWETTEAGTNYVTTYFLVPSALPTATATLEPTLTPTATSTPTRTSTPKPVIATTKAPASQGNTSSNDNAEVEHQLGTVPVTIINNNSASIKIVAVGPTTYTVTVGGGQTINVKWAPGRYNLTAYKNGSVYGTVTWDVNENHALFTIQ